MYNDFFNKLIKYSLMACITCGVIVSSAASSLAGADIKVLLEENLLSAYGNSIPDTTIFDIRLFETGQAIPENVIGIPDFTLENPGTGQFRATIIAEDGSTQSVFGIGIASMEVAVPNRRILEGEIISEADLSIIPVPLSQMGGAMIEDVGNLVGKEARRTLMPQRPVRTSSIGDPVVMERGSKLRIVYQKGSMTLLANGRSLQEGAAGQIINVVNDASGRTVQAEVIDSGTVIVRN